MQYFLTDSRRASFVRSLCSVYSAYVCVCVFCCYFQMGIIVCDYGGSAYIVFLACGLTTHREQKKMHPKILPNLVRKYEVKDAFRRMQKDFDSASTYDHF